MHYIKFYVKGGRGGVGGNVKKRFCLCRNLRREFILSITFKAIDSPETLSFKIHPRYFTFACCLISIPLYTIFKDLAFQSMCLVSNNIDFILSCSKCILNFFQQISHTHSKNLWLVAFQFPFRFYVGKLYKYHQHKVRTRWQQLTANHLCQLETRLDLK